LENTRDQQSKARLIEHATICLQSGEYSRALNLLRGAAAEFPNDTELSELEKRAHDGVKGNAEANLLITESQELFAQQKPAEAIQVLRKAYELDKKNSLARAILANALVEHAQSIVETDWLKAETLTNQALALNPAHPTAKSILHQIVDRKETSSVDAWVSQASKLQSSGDLFGALAWVAEGLAVHPHDPKLLQIQDAIQRDQEARRRQARRGDLEDLRRLQHEIDGASDVATKQALAARIQGIAARHWTDGEILSIANALLLRLGLVAQDSSSTSPRSKGATVILHVPRPSAPQPSGTDTGQILTRQDPPTQDPPPTVVPAEVRPSKIALEPTPPGNVPPGIVPAVIVPPKEVPRRSARPRKAPTAPPARAVPAPQAFAAPPAVAPALAAKIKSATSQPKRQPTKSKSTTLILVFAAAAIILVVATLYFLRKHQTPPIATNPAAVPALAAPAVSTPTDAAPAQSNPPQPAPPASDVPSDTAAETVLPDDQPPVDSSHNVGTLVVVAGQDGARVLLNGKLQRQLTRAGQLRLPNLELKDYVVQISKSGFQDPPAQKIRVRKDEQARLTFSLQPQPRLASLTIQGAAPGTTVLVDQAPVGTVQPDGTLSVPTVTPGDHVVELRKDRFKPRQLKKHFIVGGTISLAAPDAALEAASGELKITFAPADAAVAVVKGDLLKMVSSGVPLNLVPGTYTLTARTAERFTRSSTLEVVAGQSRTLDLSLAPTGMSKWNEPGAWKHEGDSFVRKGGDFVLYGIAPTSGTFAFSGMLTKGHLLQWVLNYSDPKNYVLFQMDDNDFYRTVIRKGNKTDEIIVPHKVDKKSFRTFQIRVSPAEIVHQIKHGDTWTVLDRWTQPGTNLSLGRFGFYIPGNDQIAVSTFAHYADLNIR
jgi:tetratricopeptide (TPR) repeat protein